MFKYVSKFIMYEFVAVMKGPTWPFVNPRKDKVLKGVTFIVTEPPADVKVTAFVACETANTPTLLPIVVFITARKFVEE
jgi:hypothetical protein